MRQLFTLNDDGVVEVLPQAWLFAPFKAIRDKYTEPGIAVIEMGLIYFASDYRSDFLDVPNIKDRIVKIKKNVYGSRNIKIDELTTKAIEFYIANQDTLKIKLVRSVNNAIVKAIAAIDLATFSDLKDVESLATVSSKLPSMLENLAALEKFVKKEEKLEDGVSGSGEKSLYEDEN